MLHAVGEIYEDRGKNQKQKSLKSALTARDDAMICIPWGKGVSTDVSLVPDESRVPFTKSGTTANFDIFHQAGSYMPLHVRSEKQRSK